MATRNSTTPDTRQQLTREDKMAALAFVLSDQGSTVVENFAHVLGSSPVLSAFLKQNAREISHTADLEAAEIKLLLCMAAMMTASASFQ